MRCLIDASVKYLRKSTTVALQGGRQFLGRLENQPSQVVMLWIYRHVILTSEIDTLRAFRRTAVAGRLKDLMSSVVVELDGASPAVKMIHAFSSAASRPPSTRISTDRSSFIAGRYGVWTHCHAAKFGLIRAVNPQRSVAEPLIFRNYFRFLTA
jgi:hypothetical protein